MNPRQLPSDAHARNLRLGRFSEARQPYHITKCVPRPPVHPLACDELAGIVISAIRWRQERELAHLLAFVVMPDHVHWLFILGEAAVAAARDSRWALSELLQSFSKHTSLEMNRVLGRSGPFWQEGFHDHAIRTTTEAALAVIEYIHANPVRRALCARPEDWPWSTANPRYADWIEQDWFW